MNIYLGVLSNHGKTVLEGRILRPGWTQRPCAPYRVHGPADQRRRRRNGREAGGALCFRAAGPPWPARPRCRDARQNRGRGKVGFTASVAKAAATRGEADRAHSRRDRGGGGGGSRTGRGDAKCSPGSELRGRLCEGGDNAAEAEEKGRDGASGPVLVKLNTEAWIWETSTLPLVGFRRSKGK